jgi:ribosomal protein S12 methylthiotransferase accessory factor
MKDNDNGNAIRFRGNSFHARKLYMHGTPRSIPPDEAHARILPITGRIGITRLANITGLDRVGIPTFMATRPAALVTSVSWGKGLTAEQAKLSAAMECIERYHGENACPPGFSMSYDEAGAAYRTIPLENLPLTRHSIFHRRQVERWALGWDIVNQEEVAVPRTLVSLVSFSEPTGLASFQCSSNGLAAGADFMEALTQALIEVMERDATTCHYAAAQTEGSGYFLDRVRMDSIAHPLVRDLLDRLEAVKFRPVLFDCTVDTEVPVYGCYLYDRITRGKGISKGYGASLDPEVAMVRAITEAAQSHLSYLTGALDNTPQHDFHFAQMNDNEKTIRMLESRQEKIDACRLPNQSTATFEGDIQVCIQKLKRIGLNQVIVFDLTMPGMDISVVKVIVPGLEPYRHKYYAPGRRAEACAKGKLNENDCISWTDTPVGRGEIDPRRRLSAAGQAIGPYERGGSIQA